MLQLLYWESFDKEILAEGELETTLNGGKAHTSDFSPTSSILLSCRAMCGSFASLTGALICLPTALSATALWVMVMMVMIGPGFRHDSIHSYGNAGLLK